MSRSSAYILALGWLLVLLGLIGLGLTLKLNSNQLKTMLSYTAGACPSGNSYFRSSDLTRLERKQFSSNARGFDILTKEARRARLVIDYRVKFEVRDKVDVKVYLETPQAFKEMKLQLLVNGVAVDEQKYSEDKPFLLIFQTLDLAAPQNSLGVLISQGNECMFTSNDLIKFEVADEKAKNLTDFRAEALVSDYSNKLIELRSGDNLISFEDWVYIPDLTRKGLKVFSFSSTKNRWETSTDLIAWPKRGYLVKNYTRNKMVINQPRPFRVPDDLNETVLQSGWNLISLNGSENLDNLEVYINPDPASLIAEKKFKLSDLVKKQTVKSIFEIKAGKSEKVDLSKLSRASSGQYWIKLGEDAGEFVLPNLVLSVQGVGDTYSSSQVPLKIIVENKGSHSRYVVSPAEKDPCQIRVIVRDKQRNVIDGSSKPGQCPLWPRIEELPSGSKKEYTYLWEAPKNLKGEFIIETYFNYSRLQGNQLVDVSTISIK